MTLPASGQISLSQVNTELGYSSTASITMNDSAVRTLFGVASGAISMSNGWGKANAWAGTITSSVSDLNLRTWATGAGWNGTSKATITVNSGVYIWATSTGTAGMTINGSWPGGCFLVNNGYIMGKGGNAVSCAAGATGGPAISLGVSCTITNNSYIAGGGGGGGSGTGGGGGGAGGGNGTRWPHGPCYGMPGSAGTGGTIGSAGSGGSGYTSGGGGGRILPGTGGAGAKGPAGGGGAGGGGGGMPTFTFWCFGWSAIGGNGGSAGNAGSNGYGGQCFGPYSVPFPGGGGGGGWGATGGASAGSCYTRGGGSGGKAVALNGYTVTWPATGTRYGAIS